MKTTTLKRIRRSLRECRLRLSLGLCLFEEEFCLDLFGFLIALPFMDRWHREPHEMMEKWGFCYFERSLHFNWGPRTRVVYLPWDYQHIKHEVRRPDGTWTACVPSYSDKEPDGRWTATYGYHYLLKSGEVQERLATIHVERREWRQKWLVWCPLFAKKRQSIDVMFNDEVGERAGSWKGGCVGCGYEMRKGETPEQTLRRMEREREF